MALLLHFPLSPEISLIVASEVVSSSIGDGKAYISMEGTFFGVMKFLLKFIRKGIVKSGFLFRRQHRLLGKEATWECVSSH